MPWKANLYIFLVGCV